MQLAEEKITEKGIGGRKVLVVDDQSMVAKVVRRILESSGYQAQIFDDSLLALEKFKETEKAYDLVITDLSMPGMNGISLSQEIRKLGHGTPIILYTGDNTMLKGKKPETVDVVLEKPFTKAQLLWAINNCFEGF